jgi:hypothetical protein
MGIAHEFTAAYSPQQNSIVESTFRETIVQAQRLLLEAGLDPEGNLWADAFRHALVLRNVSAHSEMGGLSPYEACYGEPYPRSSSLMTFGSPVIHVGHQDKRKWKPRGSTGIYLGMSPYHDHGTSTLLFPSGRRGYYRGVKPAPFGPEQQSLQQASEVHAPAEDEAWITFSDSDNEDPYDPVDAATYTGVGDQEDALPDIPATEVDSSDTSELPADAMRRPWMGSTHWEETDSGPSKEFVVDPDGGRGKRKKFPKVVCSIADATIPSNVSQALQDPEWTAALESEAMAMIDKN